MYKHLKMFEKKKIWRNISDVDVKASVAKRYGFGNGKLSYLNQDMNAELPPPQDKFASAVLSLHIAARPNKRFAP